MTGPERAELTPERWQLIEELFHLAREHAPAERSAFLRAACADDPALREQVEALLDQPPGPLSRDALAPLVRELVSTRPGQLEGQTLGPYVLGPLLGAGGMGEVYRATDTVLKRPVALKVLPPGLATEPGRLARFRREAELLAALNHPHIAHLYGLESSGGTLALVMELVEGSTLADRIAHGRIPLRDALAIADQLAEALEAAHARGIVHRDFKPANIKVRADGTVKVLDFGVAKVLDPAAEPAVTVPSAPAAIGSPTLETGAGVILGTALYMSPEQLQGAPADKKSDVWAFGCVLYEMLAGRPAFSGDDVAGVTASVLSETPDWSKLPDAPGVIQSLIAGCLEKNPWHRVGDIAAARFALEESTRQVEPLRSHRRWLPWAIAAAALLVSAVSLLVMNRGAVSATAPVRLSAPLGPGVAIRAARGADLAISRDGTQIAAVAFTERGPQVFVRRLDQSAFVPVAGTVGSRMPFFSPDGRWVGYFVEPMMYRVPTTGGTPIVVCEGIDDPLGAWWGDDDRIIVGRPSGAWTVPASGGALTRLPKPLEWAERWPQVLPGSRAMLFTAAHGPDPPDVMVRALPDGPPRLLVKNAYYARYAGTGHLVYASNGAIYAAPFDANARALTGDAVMLVSSVSGNTGRAFWSAQYAVSDTGTLVYTQGGGDAALDRSPLTLLSRLGVRSTFFEGLPWRNVTFSPDGSELAFEAAEPSKPGDVVILDRRNGMLRPLTVDAENDHSSPVWSPDGRKIAFAARRHNTTEPFNLYWRNADGSGSVHRLTMAKAHQFPGGWHRSGRWIVYHEIKKPGAGDILALPLDASAGGNLTPGAPRPIVESPDYTELQPSVSPDGRWVAYTSNESGVVEVYVRPFQGAGGPWKVSAGGGGFPVWSPGKNELLFSGPFQQVMVARYSTSDSSFRVEQTQPWPGAVLSAGQFRRLAVAPDGDHIVAGLIDPNSDQSVTVVLHMLDAHTPTPSR